MQAQSDQLPTSRSRAVRLDSFGGPEVLNVARYPRRRPDPERSACG